MARRHERYALTYKGGDNVNVEFIDLAGIEEGSDQLSATHHPDVFSGSCAQMPRKGFHWLRDKFHAWRRFFRGLPREHVIGDLLVKNTIFGSRPLLISKGPVVGFASPQDSINAPIEGAHAVITCVGPPIQPFHITVRPGDITIRTRSDIDDDLSRCFHLAPPYPAFGLEYNIDKRTPLIEKACRGVPGTAGAADYDELLEVEPAGIERPAGFF
jgi:hypothetical protein